MLKRFMKYIFLTVPVVLLFASFGYGQEEAVASVVKTYLPIGSGLAIGIASGFGAIGQGLAIYGGLQGISRNPGAGGKITTSLIIGLALIESLVIYSFVISFLLESKI